MSTYINTNTNEYPKHIGDLYLEGWNDGDNLPDGWFLVKETQMPEVNEGQAVRESMPIFINDQWTQQWELYDITQEMIEQSIFFRPKMPWEAVNIVD